MKCDLILCGVGGQGVLSIAHTISHAAIQNGLFVKQPEVHGMAQRGGAVFTHLRLSDEPIHSDLIPVGKCDIICAMEPMEALRYTHYLASDGQIVVHKAPVENIPNYPNVEDIYEELSHYNTHLLDAAEIARGVASLRSTNVALLGALAVALPVSAEALETEIARRFQAKGEAVVSGNIAAFRAGMAAVNSKVEKADA